MFKHVFGVSKEGLDQESVLERSGLDGIKKSNVELALVKIETSEGKSAYDEALRFLDLHGYEAFRGKYIQKTPVPEVEPEGDDSEQRISLMMGEARDWALGARNAFGAVSERLAEGNPDSTKKEK